MSEAARGKPVHLPQKGRMRLLIHVEDIAEVFARVLLAAAPQHALYNSGGIPVSLGELADIAREFLPTRRLPSRRTAAARNPATTCGQQPPVQGVRHRVPALATRVLEISTTCGERRRCP